MLSDNFRDNLADYLERQGWGAQSRLAEHLGVKPPFITQLLKGDCDPSLERIEQIAEFFGVTGARMLKAPRTRAGHASAN